MNRCERRFGDSPRRALAFLLPLFGAGGCDQSELPFVSDKNTDTPQGYANGPGLGFSGGSGNNTASGSSDQSGSVGSNGSGDKGSFLAHGAHYQVTCAEAYENEDAVLRCPAGTVSEILFASYGTPEGHCGNFSYSWCHAVSSVGIVQAQCLGREHCTLPAIDELFGNPCIGFRQRLAIEARCSGDATPACVTEMEFASPCDGCLRSSCCDSIQSCDLGTDCYEIEQCRKSLCGSYSEADVPRCVNKRCNDRGFEALNAWTDYWDCRANYCLGQCDWAD